VTQPRWPCFKLNLYRKQADIQARLRASRRTGWYLRVVEPGEAPAAGPIHLAHKDLAGLSVLDAHLAMSDLNLVDLDRARAVSEHPALAEQWRAPLLRRLRRRITTS
jgi:MOSC domain-containing protein YiiM